MLQGVSSAQGSLDATSAVRLGTGLVLAQVTCSEARSGMLLGVLVRWARLALSAAPNRLPTAVEVRPHRQAGRSLD